MCENCAGKRGKFYVTTPIYYPSDNLHIGHAYCTTATDTLARFKRLQGYDTWFLTGLDEHGQKIERKAEAKGVSPQEYVDKICEDTKELWRIMDISYDDFIRTTEPRHTKIVQKIFEKLYRARRYLQGRIRRLVLHPLRELLDGASAGGRQVSRLRPRGGKGS